MTYVPLCCHFVSICWKSHAAGVNALCRVLGGKPNAICAQVPAKELFPQRPRALTTLRGGRVPQVLPAHPREESSAFAVEGVRKMQRGLKLLRRERLRRQPADRAELTLLRLRIHARSVRRARARGYPAHPTSSGLQQVPEENIAPRRVAANWLGSSELERCRA